MNKQQFSKIMHYAEFITAGAFIGAVYSAGKIGDPVVAGVVGVALIFIYLERKFRLAAIESDEAN